jgi:hypothetical protein
MAGQNPAIVGRKHVPRRSIGALRRGAGSANRRVVACHGSIARTGVRGVVQTRFRSGLATNRPQYPFLAARDTSARRVAFETREAPIGMDALAKGSIESCNLGERAVPKPGGPARPLACEDGQTLSSRSGHEAVPRLTVGRCFVPRGGRVSGGGRRALVRAPGVDHEDAYR